MVPPFLAYYGVATADVDHLQHAVTEIKLYNQVLGAPIVLSDESKCHGLWRHIESQPLLLPSEVCCTDPYIWLTR
jgi:hypothetical protein